MNSNILMGPGVFGLIFLKSKASSIVDGHEQGRVFSLLGMQYIIQYISCILFLKRQLYKNI